jgi:hypothetical protein
MSILGVSESQITNPEDHELLVRVLTSIKKILSAESKSADQLDRMCIPCKLSDSEISDYLKFIKLGGDTLAKQEEGDAKFIEELKKSEEVFSIDPLPKTNFPITF